MSLAATRYERELHEMARVVVKRKAMRLIAAKATTRGQSRAQLIAELVEKIAEDDLFSAVLDE